MTDVALLAEGLQTYYGKSHILHEVSIEVHEGEIVTLLGRNGAGIVAIVPELCRFLHSVVGDLRSFYPCLPYHCRHRRSATSFMATVAGTRAHHMRCNPVSVDLGCHRRSRADSDQLALAS